MIEPAAGTFQSTRRNLGDTVLRVVLGSPIS